MLWKYANFSRSEAKKRGNNAKGGNSSGFNTNTN